MRFQSLHLLRYGALTDRHLTFRADAALHLIYGPNEAGKSSALAAIGDLLFGFQHAKSFDFLHDAATLRIGAELRAADGTLLALRRRRGNKNTLLAADADEAGLREDALAPFLGSLTREMFQRAFGLDSGRLRAGAVEMLRSEGELGETLFAAASGILGLSTVKADLDGEAEKLFAPRAAKDRLFYQLRDRHDAARKAETNSELRAGDWKKLVGAIADIEVEHQGLDDRRAQTRTALARLRRLRQLQPVLADIDAEAGALAGLADMAALPAGLADRLAAALAGIETARYALTGVGAERDRAAKALGEIVVDEAILGHAEAITALFARTGDTASKQRDLPRIEAEQYDYDGDIRQLARQLGVEAPEALPALQPTAAALALVRSLVAEGRGLIERIAVLRRRVEEERDALAGLDAGRDLGELIDTRLWRDRFAALAPDLKAIERRDDLLARHRSATRKLAEDAARLVLPVADLTQLAARPLPQLEPLSRHRHILDAHETALRGAAAARKNLLDDAARLDRAIAEAEQAGPMPSRKTILEARLGRDGLLEGLRETLSGAVPDVANARAGLAGLQRAVTEADRLADDALRDADRVARHADALARRAALTLSIQAADAEAAALQAERDAADAAYRALFAGSGIDPLAPAAMADWLKSVAALLAERQNLATLADDIAACDALAETIRPALAEIAEGIGGAFSATLPVAALQRAIAERLTLLGDIWSESRSLAGKRDEAFRRLTKTDAELTATLEQEQDWWVRCTRAVPAIGLRPEATLEEAAAAIAVWEKLPAIAGERDNRARRVAGMRRDIHAFETEANDLVAALAADMAGLPAASLADHLRQRLDAARASRARQQDAARALAEADTRLSAATQAASIAAAALAEQTAGLPPDTDLPLVIARLRRRDELRKTLELGRRRFRDLAEGHDEADIRADMVAFDRERAGFAIETLEAEDGRLVHDMGELYARRAELLRQRDALEAGGGAELAVAQRLATEAEIVDVARQWVVLKLASTLLGSAMEKHRETQTDPLLRRAGDLFATLTGGAFSRLVQDFGEDDRTHLLGERQTGERIAIDAMSEGTRDQLFLALRLAYLEDYARRNEPAPFIGDDIFQTFDDVRTRAGLKTLAQTSASFQPILFTHHQSVVAIATQTLGDAVDLIEL